MIRPSTPADAHAVAAVHETARRAYYEAACGRPVAAKAVTKAVTGAVTEPDPDRLAMWAAVLADPGRAHVLCAEAAGSVVGFLSMGPPIHEQPAPGPVLEMHGLYVLPRHWSSGIGTRLHDRFTDNLAAGSFTRGVLDVWSRNAAAIAFYRRRGWVSDGRSRPGPDGTTYDGMSLVVE